MLEVQSTNATSIKNIPITDSDKSLSVTINRRGDDWTEERHEYLKQCWAAGMSAEIAANQINRKFGTSYTRNAIIGRVSRHALSVLYGRVKAAPSIASPYSTHRRRTVYRAMMRLKAPEPCRVAPAIDDTAIPFEQRKTLAQLSERDGFCRWPVGEPSSPDFFYCGGKASEGSSYCAGHCAVAYYYRPRQ